MRPYSRPLVTVMASVLAACNSAPGAAAGPTENLTDAEREIGRLAIDALAADLQVPRDRIRVDTVQAVDWPDSSAGCPQPGIAYMQVITAGHKISLRADGNIHVVNEANRRAFVCRQNDATGEHDATPACESARILKIRTVERAEGQRGGPTPPTEEGAPPPPRSIASPIYHVSLECGGKNYIARVLGGTPGFDPEQLAAAGTLRLRTDDGKVFLKSEQGAEFEAILASAPSSDASPPR